MFTAALWSRSCTIRHSGQAHDLIFNGMLPMMCPQAEQVFELGNQRETLWTARP